MRAKSTFSNSTSKSYAVALYELVKENFELDNADLNEDGLINILDVLQLVNIIIN